MAAELPRQVRFIVSTEACERFSYYGMLSILTLYLKNALGMAEGETKETVHLFKMAVYFLPLLGAWIADRWWGRYRTILRLSLLYCVGHGALAVMEGTRTGIYVGLALIALGAGGIKPCVSAFVGDQFTASQHGLLPKVYGLFYWAVNIGALFAFALIPVARDHWGYAWAFGIPGLFMGLATVIFWAGARHYRHTAPARAAEGAAVGGKNDGDRGALWRIVLVLAPVPVFWALFDQINSTWVFQAEKMTPFALLGYKVDAERMQSASALLVLIWVPVLAVWGYPLAERWGWRPTALRRMGAGMLCAAASFVICGWMQTQLDAGIKMSLAWQLVPYVVLEAGEVMLSATGLEFAYAQAPAHLKSTVMSLWLCTTAIGNFLVAVITGVNSRWVHASGAGEFYFYAALMLVVAGVFGVIAARYRGIAEVRG